MFLVRHEMNTRILLVFRRNSVFNSAWELATDTFLLKLRRLQNTVLSTIGNFPRFTPVRNTRFQPSVCVRLYNKIMQTTSRSHTKYERVRSIGQGEARCRKYLGSVQAYDRSRE
jgi:hypothetical protein